MNEYTKYLEKKRKKEKERIHEMSEGSWAWEEVQARRAPNFC